MYKNIIFIFAGIFLITGVALGSYYFTAHTSTSEETSDSYQFSLFDSESQLSAQLMTVVESRDNTVTSSPRASAEEILPPPPATPSSDDSSGNIIQPILSPVEPLIQNSTSSNPVLNSKSYVLYDVKTAQPLLIANADSPLRIASITKIITTITILDSLSTSSLIAVPEILKGFEEQFRIFGVGEVLTVQELLKAMLIASSNEATTILAQLYEQKTGVPLIDAMNVKARALGLSQTHLANVVGYDTTPNISTALDLIQLAQKTREYSLFNEVAHLTSVTIHGKNKNYLLKSTNEPFILSLSATSSLVHLVKTGTTEQAKENLIMTFDYRERPMILVLLNSTERINDFNKVIGYLKKVFVEE